MTEKRPTHSRAATARRSDVDARTTDASRRKIAVAQRTDPPCRGHVTRAGRPVVWDSPGRWKGGVGVPVSRTATPRRTLETDREGDGGATRARAERGGACRGWEKRESRHLGENGATLNFTDEEERTGHAKGSQQEGKLDQLSMAILRNSRCRGDVKKVKFLLRPDATEGATTGVSRQALRLAVRKNDEHIVQLLLAERPNVEVVESAFEFVMERIVDTDREVVEQFLQLDYDADSVWTQLIECLEGPIKNPHISSSLIGSICSIGSDSVQTALVATLFAANRRTQHTGSRDCACAQEIKALRVAFRQGLDPMVYLLSRLGGYQVRQLNGCGVCHIRHPLCDVCVTSRSVLPSAQCLSFLVRMATVWNSRYIHQWALDYLDNPQVLMPRSKGDFSEYWNTAVLLMRCGGAPTTQLWSALFPWDTIPRRFRVHRNRMFVLRNQNSLSDACRLVIRKHVGGPNMLWALHQFRYPEKLREFILFSNEDYVTQLCEAPTERSSGED